MRNSSRIEYLQNPRRKLSAHKIESKYLESCTILDNETMASPQSQSKSSGTSGLFYVLVVLCRCEMKEPLFTIAFVSNINRH